MDTLVLTLFFFPARPSHEGKSRASMSRRSTRRSGMGGSSMPRGKRGGAAAATPAQQRGVHPDPKDQLRRQLVHSILEEGRTFKQAWNQWTDGADSANGCTRGAYQKWVYRHVRRDRSRSPGRRRHGNRLLPDAAERALVGVAIGFARAHQPLTIKSFARVATRVARARGLAQLERPLSEKWVRRFVRRHQDRICAGHPSTIRPKRDSHERSDLVEEFVEGFSSHRDCFGSGPHRVVNADETTVDVGSTLFGRLRIVEQGRGKKFIIAHERKTRVTFLPFVTAAGEVVAVFYVLQGKQVGEDMLRVDMPMPTEDDTPNTRARRRREASWPRYFCASIKGYVTTEIWSNIVEKAMDDYALLHPGVVPTILLDNCSSHTKQFAREMATTGRAFFQYLVPNTTHVLQPLDNGVFARYKEALAEELLSAEEASIAHAEDLTSLFLARVKAAEAASLTEAAVKHGFERTGIYPWKPDLVRRRVLRSTPAQERAVPTAGPSPESIALAVADVVEDRRRTAVPSHLVGQVSRRSGARPETIDARARNFVTPEEERAQKQARREQRRVERQAAQAAERERQAQGKKRKKRKKARRIIHHCRRGRTGLTPKCPECRGKIWPPRGEQAEAAVWCEYCECFGYCAHCWKHHDSGMRRHLTLCERKDPSARDAYPYSTESDNSSEASDHGPAPEAAPSAGPDP